MESTDVKKPTFLIVMAAKDDMDHPLRKIMDSERFANAAGKMCKVKTTDYDSFMDGKRKTNFDAVLLTFFKDVSADDIEMKEEYYDEYTQAPIVAFAVCSQDNEQEEINNVSKVLIAKVGNRLISKEPYVFEDLKDTTAGADKFGETLKDLFDKYESMKNGSVKEAFSKFDKDSSGNIDINELQGLMELLGCKLEGDELQKQMKELDLNEDGVVDFDEFSRWYFSGMRSYTKNKRSMIQMRNKAVSILDVLKKTEIEKLAENKKMTKHRVKLQFNDPQDAYYVEAKLHLLGPFTEQLQAETKAFVDSLGDKIKPEFKGPGSVFVYSEASVSMKAGGKAKYEEWCKKIEEDFNNVLPQGSTYEPQAAFKLIADDDKITAKVVVCFPAERPPDGPARDLISDSLKEGLKDVDQFMRYKVTLGFDGEEILKSDKALIEHLQSGFKVEAEICFLQHIKEAFLKSLPDDAQGPIQQIQQMAGMSGPAFALNSNVSVELSFDDMKSVTEHPMAGAAMVNLNQLLQGMLGMDIESLQAWKPDYKGHADKAQFQEYKDSLTYGREKEMAKFSGIFELVDEFLNCIAQDTKIEVKVNAMGYGAIHYVVEGAGYGELAHLGFQAGSKPVREMFCERLVEDFNNSSFGPSK